RIVRALELYSHEIRQAFGLTAPQLWALKTLERAGRPMSIGELAEALLVNQSSASILVARMEREGLVTRRRTKLDRRATAIGLSAKGKDLAIRTPDPAQGRLLHGLRGMTPLQLRMVRRVIDQLVTMMEATDLEARFFFADG